MEIKTKIMTRSAGEVDVVYHDIDSYDDANHVVFNDVGILAFYKEKLVIVYDKGRERWTPIGGKIEAGETPEQAVEREVKEESNMKVLKQISIGYQTVYFPDKTVNQTRTLCIVEPYGPFISDPDGDIVEIKLINPGDFKKYFDYGEVQDRVMERIFSILNSSIT